MAVGIGNKLVGPGHPCFVIAEIGINHNGSLEIAKWLIDAAVVAGCDAVKFQKRTVRRVYTPEELVKPRQVDVSIINNAMERIEIEGVRYPVFPETNLRRLEKDRLNTTNGDLKYALEFELKEYDIIDRYCQERGIPWSASAWDGLSAHFINGFNVPYLKIASACLTHADLLRRVRYKGKPVILSTGGSTMEQIERAVEILGVDNLVILHCVANYPCKDEEINLRMIETLRTKFKGTPIGYSGHEKDILPSLAAVNMGACVIERHITLDKNMPGSDHKASLEPHEFRDLVTKIRALDDGSSLFQILGLEIVGRLKVIAGDGIKMVYESEAEVMKKLRRKRDF